MLLILRGSFIHCGCQRQLGGRARCLRRPRFGFGQAPRLGGGIGFSFHREALGGDARDFLLGGNPGKRQNFGGLLGLKARMRGGQRGTLRRYFFLRQFLALRFPLGAGGAGCRQFSQRLLLAPGFGAGNFFGFETGPQGGFGGLLGARFFNGQTPGLGLDADALPGLLLGHHFGLRALLGGGQQHRQVIDPPLGIAPRPLIKAGLRQGIGLSSAMVVERRWGFHVGYVVKMPFVTTG